MTRTVDQIEKALVRYIDELNIAPCVFINKSTRHAKPYLVLEHVRGEKTNPGLTPGGKVNKGMMVIKIITEKNAHTNKANAIAERLEQALPFGLTLDAGTAKLRLYKETSTEQGYETDASFCTPVSAHYIVTAK